MKLSDAIRKGSKLNPQGFGTLKFSMDGRTCALGAALDGIEYAFDPSALHMKAIRKSWPEVMNKAVCPCHKEKPKKFPDCGVPDSLSHIIVHLNDDHKWTREAIAEWIDSLTTNNIVADKKEYSLV
jgi:hypothetical protein